MQNDYVMSVVYIRVFSLKYLWKCKKQGNYETKIEAIMLHYYLLCCVF